MFGLTLLDNVAESGAVAGVLGDGLAEVVALAGPVVNDQLQVVDGDGAAYGVAQGLDHVDGGLGSGVLKNDLELGEGQVNVLQVPQELFFRVHDANVLRSIQEIKSRLTSASMRPKINMAFKNRAS